MEHYLHALLESNDIPILTAFILGLMTAISPCPMASNITAVAFVSKDINSRQKVFLNGLVYTLGRAIPYTLIGLAFYFFGELTMITSFLQDYGEKILGPLLVLIGLIMLGIIPIKLPGGGISEGLEKKSKSGYWGVLLMGIVFALAFCPTSGVFFFMGLIPLTIASPQGLYLPVIFAIGTGIPAIIFSWILAFSVGSLSKAYAGLKQFELWFRRIIALIFIGMGIFLSIQVYF